MIKTVENRFIDSNDVILLKAYLDGALTFNMYQKLAADLNHDMIIDESDLQLLSDFVNNIITSEEIDLSWITFDPEFEMPSTEETDIMPYPTSKTIEIKNRSASGIDLMIFQMGDLGDDLQASKIKFAESVSERSLGDFTLKSIAPNPFRNETTFTLEVNIEQKVTIQFYDLNGKIISQLSKELYKGTNTIAIDRMMLSHSGIYFYKINAGDKNLQGKLIMME